jgi:multiple sugar transport system permease protein
MRISWRLRAVPKHVVLCAASLVMLYPLLWMLASSFKPHDQIFSSASLWPRHFELGSYVRGWAGLQYTFGRFFVNSIMICALSVIGNLLACSMAAFAFTRLRFAGRAVFFALMMGTLMVPYHAVLIPQYVMFLKLGWVNTILPLVVPKFLATDGYFIFLMVQFFRGIPRELDEAASIDGCGAWSTYWRVMLPLSVPVLATAAIFTFIFTWDDFFAPLVYLNNMSAYTVQLGLRSFVDSSGLSDWGGLFAMSVLALFPVFLVFLFFQRLLIAGIATTGLKR